MRVLLYYEQINGDGDGLKRLFWRQKWNGFRNSKLPFIQE